MNNVVFLPGSPALIPELSPSDEASRRLLSSAVEVISHATTPSDRPIHVVSSRDKRWYTAHKGSLRAWGAPQVNVEDGHYLGELVARYVLSHANISQSAVAETRAHIGELNSEALTIIVVDGSAGLTARAPLALLDSAEEINQWCQEVLRGNNAQVGTEAISEHKLVDAGVVEPQLWQELAAVQPRKAELIDVDVTLGVGRYVAAWEV
ncbi:hypothetical protein ACTXJT_00310 [Corynebacterium casei]|uniref:hypothetical protein n=1 Tax=Corynebacterium casei TaxID=160386 RepID=UPI003FD44209